MIKKILKKIVSYIFVYIGLAILFFALMVATYSLPNNRIRGHVAESVAQLKNEGVGYAPFFQTGSATLDTHTDALMLNIAMNKGMAEDQRKIQKAVENSFYEDESKAAISSLENGIGQIVNNHEYSRYWHGIQVLIRPLLIFFNYSEIRYILMFLIFSLLAVAFSMIGRQVGIRYAIAFAITISMMYIVLIPMPIQYSSVFIITLLGIIATLFLYKIKQQKYVPMLFFIIGGFATFFDLLTYPLVTLGLPIALAVILENRRGKTLLQQIFFIIKLGILWALGYSMLFFAKWVIASIVLHKDAVTLALNELLFRVNGNEKYPVVRMTMLKNNFEYFFVPMAKYIVTVIFAIWLVLFILYRKEIKKCKVAIPLLCIAIVPYIWYLAFAGHSSIHCWFTNKIQAMTIFAILCALGETIDKNKIGKYLKSHVKNYVIKRRVK